MECEFPTVNSNKEEIKEIFESIKTIAVLGLSPDTTKASHRVAKYLQEVGYKIIPVYPKGDEILGEKVYRSLVEIPDSVDMVDVFRKPDVIMSVVDESLKRGDVKYVWTQLGLVNNKAGQKAIDAGLEVVQNHCTKIEHAYLF